MKTFEYEINMDKSYRNIDSNLIEEWAAAVLWIDSTGNNGIEYNYSIDNTLGYPIDSSAFYKFHDNEEGYPTTDYDEFVSYQIDFNEYNWKEKLIKAMIEATKKLWDL